MSVMCLCLATCYFKHEHIKSRMFEKDHSYEFEVCPDFKDFRGKPCFKVISGEGVKDVEVNFDTASEDELRHAEYKPVLLRKYLESKCAQKVPKGAERDKMVDMLLDYRYRHVNPSDLNRVM